VANNLWLLVLRAHLSAQVFNNGVRNLGIGAESPARSHRLRTILAIDGNISSPVEGPIVEPISCVSAADMAADTH
jgi:hypothetical protein